MSSAVWGDYDNDGKLDILLAGRTIDNVPITRLYRNTGRDFVEIGATLPGVMNSSLAWGDYDNDGRLDILLTGTTADNKPIALGNAQTGLTATLTLPPSSYYWSVQAIDTTFAGSRFAAEASFTLPLTGSAQLQVPTVNLPGAAYLPLLVKGTLSPPD